VPTASPDGGLPPAPTPSNRLGFSFWEPLLVTLRPPRELKTLDIREERPLGVKSQREACQLARPLSATHAHRCAHERMNDALDATVSAAESWSPTPQYWALSLQQRVHPVIIHFGTGLIGVKARNNHLVLRFFLKEVSNKCTLQRGGRCSIKCSIGKS
jgi:hypothetical protein